VTNALAYFEKFNMCSRVCHPVCSEQRYHQAERGGRYPEAEDQVVEEGTRRRSLPGANIIFFAWTNEHTSLLRSSYILEVQCFYSTGPRRI